MSNIHLLIAQTGCTPELAATLLNTGLVSQIALRNRAIRNRFDGLVRAGAPRMQAYFDLADEFAVSESTIMQVLKTCR